MPRRRRGHAGDDDEVAVARFRPHKMYPGALLAQEVCSYQAMTQLLMEMQGSLAVLIHSDRDCSNVIQKTGRGNGLHPEWDRRFFCTNLKEHELVAGQGNAKLRRAIDVVEQAVAPELLVVLSTCPTVMIGDNMKNVARKAGRDLGRDVVAQVTHGLRPKSPAEVLDDCYSLLCRGARRTREDVERRVNLVGIGMNPAEEAELREGLGALGLEVNVVLNERSELSAFRAVPDARFNIHPGPHMLEAFDGQCQKDFSMTAIEVPLPIGVAATDRFFATVARAVGIDESGPATLSPRRDAAVAAVASFRERTAAGRLRLGYNIGSVRSFDLRRIALEETGELPLFEELGFAIHLYIQGPADADNVARTAGVLGELGIAHPFTIFRDPGGLGRVLGPGQLDLFFGVDFLRLELERVSAPLLDQHEVRLGYDGAVRSIDAMAAHLGATFYRQFAEIAGRIVGGLATDDSDVARPAPAPR